MTYIKIDNYKLSSSQYKRIILLLEAEFKCKNSIEKPIEKPIENPIDVNCVNCEVFNKKDEIIDIYTDDDFQNNNDNKKIKPYEQNNSAYSYIQSLLTALNNLTT